MGNNGSEHLDTQDLAESVMINSDKSWREEKIKKEEEKRQEAERQRKEEEREAEKVRKEEERRRRSEEIQSNLRRRKCEFSFFSRALPGRARGKTQTKFT